MSKFKFIFEDSATAIITAEDYRDAAVLAMANRIRAKKSKTLCGMWAFDEENKTWERAKQNQVSFALA